MSPSGCNTAVISEDIARKYFGDEDPLGKRFRFGNDEEYTITGVIASPENSHLKINFLLSYATLVQQWGDYFETAWGWYDFYNYIKLAPGADPAMLETKLPDFIAEVFVRDVLRDDRRVGFIERRLPVAL